MKYRPEIDGLRAVAVLPVILFHAGFSLFSGGFVGVDVFFVISGYLITRLIADDLSQNRFSLLTFYERRARRILPALVLVIACCLPFAWAWMLPDQFRDFSQSMIAVGLFVSNIWFWRDSGYFARAAEEKPLLHTWSLAVEEQFYLLFPLLLILLWRTDRKWTIAVLTALVLTSLGAAEWGSRNAATATFYLLPTRAWELLIGSLCALAPTIAPTISQARRNTALSALGLALIAYAVLRYTHRTPFPSTYALLPTLGTALVLLFATPGTLTARLLSFKPIVGLGLISYSAYLWHQPLFAFARVYHMHSPLPPPRMLMIALALATLPLAWLSWRFVEHPFRRKNRPPLRSRTAVFAASGLATVALIGFGIAGYATNGMENRFSTTDHYLLNYQGNYWDRLKQRDAPGFDFAFACFLERKETVDDMARDCRSVTSPSDLFFWGDSHAHAIALTLHKTQPDIGLIAAMSCPPLPATKVSFGGLDSPECNAINTLALRTITKTKPARIVLHANWPLYLDYAIGGMTTPAELAVALRQSGDLIRAASPTSQIIILGATPEWNPTLPVVIWRAGTGLPDALSLPNDLIDRSRALNRAASAAFPDTGPVRFVDPLTALCTKNRCLATLTQDGETDLTAWDYGHPTGVTSRFLVQQFLVP